MKWSDLTPEQQLSFIDYVNVKRKVKREPDRYGNPVRLLMTFEEIRDLWLASGQINNRGTEDGEYCMSRLEDFGDYLPGGCVIKLTSENSREAKLGRPSSNKGRVSPTKGMKMPTQKCQHCTNDYPNSAARHHIDGRCAKA